MLYCAKFGVCSCRCAKSSIMKLVKGHGLLGDRVAQSPQIQLEPVLHFDVARGALRQHTALGFLDTRSGKHGCWIGQFNGTFLPVASQQ